MKVLMIVFSICLIFLLSGCGQPVGKDVERYNPELDKDCTRCDLRGADLVLADLTGADLTEDVWDAFWEFYQDTGMRKWGTPYLTREAFTLLGERMGERLLLIFAYLNGQPVAGAMNVIGGTTLFGRYWGCLVDIPFLHFELCYYQAIDAAIARGLSRVEAGAQGGHKLARGYAPVQTRSAHYIADPGLRAAVAEFLERERQGIAAEQNFLEERTPFRKG